MISAAITKCMANFSGTMVRRERRWLYISCRIRTYWLKSRPVLTNRWSRRRDGVDQEFESFQLSGLDRREQREAQTSRRKCAGLGRRRDDGHRGGWAQPAARLSRRSHRGVLLPVEGKHYTPPHGDSGQAASGSANQRGRNIPFAQA